MEYPKIETLFNRDDRFKVVEGDYRLKEFEQINRWMVTEKIDGTNVRIVYQPVYEPTGEGHPGFFEVMRYLGMELLFKGRTDKAEFHPDLKAYLERTFTAERMETVFGERMAEKRFAVHLFGEAYGPKIQSGGKYRKDISVKLFDVYVEDRENPLGGWWLEPDDVEDVACKLGVTTVPRLPDMTTAEIVSYVKTGKHSIVSQLDGGDPSHIMEGVVARTQPLMFTRRGERVMFKLKRKDF